MRKSEIRAAAALRSVRIRDLLLLGVFVVGGAALGCTRESTASPRSPGTGGDVPEVLATVGGEEIKVSDLGTRAVSQLEQLEGSYLRNRSQIIESALEEVVRDRMLQAEARKQGKTAEELIAAEAGGFDITEVEISTWYTENRARMGGRSLDQVRDQIADFLRNERRTQAAKNLEERLTREMNVAVNFQPYRLAFNNEGAPSLGRRGAPVEVVEFSDFQCPFCQRFAPTLKQLASNFGDQVYIVYRQFPITSIHPLAFKAAEASLCAHEQGKFWDMHDIMFQEMNRLMVPDLKDKARRVGLNGSRFDSCLDSGQYTQQVQQDLEEGQRAGVSGTPAVFINGTLLPGGAVPYETVAAAVQKELDRVQQQ
jgi:protein-disulfide isomerase